MRPATLVLDPAPRSGFLRPFAFSALVFLPLLLLGVAGCSQKPEEEDEGPIAPPVSTSATMTLRTGESGTLRNSEGVEIMVFPGTVPTTTLGQPGTLVFSVEPAVVTAPAPAGYAAASAAWQLGPEGINFADRCRVVMPALDLAGGFVLGRYDASSGAWEIVPTIVDPAAPDRICADVKHLSIWGLFRQTGTPSSPGAMGAVRLQNVDGTRTVSLCLKSFTLANPGAHPNFDPSSAGAIVAEAGHNGGAGGLRNEIDLVLPQGTYVFEATRSTTLPSVLGTTPDGWVELPAFTVEGAWSPGETDSIVTLDPSGWVAPSHSPERAPCEGEPDYAFGTGDVQVTLTWEDPVDLDLHVFEPGGEEIYFGHTFSASGGVLDRDTICEGTQTGKPENIFWPEGAAPHGAYAVKVHLYSLCQVGSGEIAFHVRTVVDGAAHTYTATVSGNQTKTVAQFFR
jgi:hypothetical protein